MIDAGGSDRWPAWPGMVGRLARPRRPGVRVRAAWRKGRRRSCCARAMRPADAALLPGDDLDEVAAGVVEDGHRHVAGLEGRLREPDAQGAEALELGVYVGDGKRGEGGISVFF